MLTGQPHYVTKTGVWADVLWPLSGLGVGLAQSECLSCPGSLTGDSWHLQHHYTQTPDGPLTAWAQGPQVPAGGHTSVHAG